MNGTTPPTDSRPLVPLLEAFVGWVHRGLCLIQDRDTGQIVPLRPNYVQVAIVREMMRQACRGRPIRIIVPKARKMGVSTIVEALGWFVCAYETGRHAVTYGHTDQDTRAIFSLALRIHAGTGREAPQSGMRIDFPHGSRYECRTAGGLGAGRGDTVHVLHLTELAALQSLSGLDSDAVQALLNSVPHAPITIVVIESTGDGASGEFYDRCMDAQRGLGEFQLLFFPWHKDDRYQIPSAEVLPSFALTDEEERMQSAHGLTTNQVAWYRRAFESACGDGRDAARVARFRHEFPTVLEDCFCAAGDRVFPWFSRERNMKAFEVDPAWDRYRCIDWGSTHEHPFVCAWVAHDPAGPPGLFILDDPSMEDAIREFIAYRRNSKTGKPIKSDDHVPDAIRLLIVTARLTGTVYIYRLIYDRAPPPHAELARIIHERTGYDLPTGWEDGPMDFRRLIPRADAETIALTVADRARPDLIDQYSDWGIPMVGHTDKLPKVPVDGEVEGGIFLVGNLIAGLAFAWLLPEEREPKLVADALAKRHGIGSELLRPRSLSREEQEAVRRLYGLDDDSEADQFIAPRRLL